MKLNILRFTVSILVCQLAGILGGFFTSNSVKTWYTSIQKPSFTPPNWLFGPVWILLYLLMGISLYFIWDSNSQIHTKQLALILFFIQLGLNVLWSFLFFYHKNPLLGFVDIVLLFIFIFLTILTFYPINRTAAFLLLPYLLWVGFAALLNYSIWMLNR